MSLWLAALVLLLANAATVATMLLLRRRAPTGSYFEDTQQAAGVFAVAGTTFAVLVAFTFLLAFQSYDDARNSAEDEATAVNSLFHTAEFFSAADRDRLQGDLVCYGRAVAAREWTSMRDGRRDPLVTRWASGLEHDFQRVRVTGAVPAAAASNWFDQTDLRQRGRTGRISESQPLVPALVWMFLIIGGAVVVGFTFFFADRRERPIAQAGLLVAITTFVVASLVMVHFLDNPYENRSGSIKPTEMRVILTAIRSEQARQGTLGSVRCDPGGRPRRARPA